MKQAEIQAGQTLRIHRLNYGTYSLPFLVSMARLVVKQKINPLGEV
jgi:hypothetical protein